MSQKPRSKEPMDNLQTMINMALLETGKALRPVNIGSGKTSAMSYPKLRSTIPVAMEVFHCALDEIETEIIRAKAVLERDLELLRSKRIASDNSSTKDHILTPKLENVEFDRNQQLPTQAIKQEQAPTFSLNISQSPATVAIKTDPMDASDRTTSPTRASSDFNTQVQEVRAGINPATSPGTGAPQESTRNTSIDSLFEVPDSATENKPDVAEFSSSNGRNFNQHEQHPQPVPKDLDMAALEVPYQEVNTSILTTPESNNALDVANNKISETTDDPLAMVGSAAANDDLGLDLNLERTGAEDSVFGGILFHGDDGTGGARELEHGQFDNAFFGLDD